MDMCSIRTAEGACEHRARSRIAVALALALALALAVCVACGMGGCSCTSEDGQAKAPKSISDKKANGGSSSGKTVAKSEEKSNPDGSRTITYTYADGTTQTIIVTKDAEVGSGVSQSSGSSDSDASSFGGDTGSESVVPGDLPGDKSTEYEQFMAKSVEERFTFFKTFENPDDFRLWFQAAMAEYQEKHPSIVIDEGDVIGF